MSNTNFEVRGRIVQDFELRLLATALLDDNRFTHIELPILLMHVLGLDVAAVGLPLVELVVATPAETDVMRMFLHLSMPTTGCGPQVGAGFPLWSSPRRIRDACGLGPRKRPLRDSINNSPIEDGAGKPLRSARVARELYASLKLPFGVLPGSIGGDDIYDAVAALASFSCSIQYQSTRFVTDYCTLDIVIDWLLHLEEVLHS